MILKNISYSRGGIGGGKDGFKTKMSYKGTDVVEFNTTTNTHSLMNEETNEGKKLENLLNRLFEKK